MAALASVADLTNDLRFGCKGMANFPTEMGGKDWGGIAIVRSCISAFDGRVDSRFQYNFTGIGIARCELQARIAKIAISQRFSSQTISDRIRMELPRLLRIRQNFEATPPIDIPSTLDVEFIKLRDKIHAGDRIAVGVGSRGITHLAEIVAEVLEQLRRIGAKPFIIPAMGSHGGATPQGQRDVLARYGITEESMNVPIRDSLEVRQVGVSSDQVAAYCSTEALAADGIILINRIKPHTDFAGTLGSGLLKMCVIGLGKRTGATTMHLSGIQIGYERVIRGLASVILQNAPVLGGIGIIENQFHDIARLLAIRSENMEAAEADLVVEA